MKRSTAFFIVIGLISMFFTLSACTGAAAPTATSAPPTEASTAPPPTEAPTATATSVPTPTSAPGEMNSAQQLGLGAEFLSLPKDQVIEKVPAELVLYRVLIEDPRHPMRNATSVNWHDFPVEASFAFVNADNTQFVYGYTVSLSDSKAQTRFDSVFVQQLYAIEKRTFIYVEESAPIEDVKVGEASAGMTAKWAGQSSWRYSVVSFRVGSTGAFVFTIYPASATAPIDIIKLAEIYAGTLK